MSRVWRGSRGGMATAITATKVSWPNCLPSHKIILWQQQQLVLAAAADKLQVVLHVAHTRAGKTRATREREGLERGRERGHCFEEICTFH